MMNATDRRRANVQLAYLAYGRRNTLGEFIEAARQIDPEIEAALEGIWCGTSGTVRTELDERHLLVVEWYDSKVEVAYIS